MAGPNDYSETETIRRREATIKNMLPTPPKPRAAKKKAKRRRPKG
jgi:hypothetical protein